MFSLLFGKFSLTCLLPIIIKFLVNIFCFYSWLAAERRDNIDIPSHRVLLFILEKISRYSVVILIFEYTNLYFIPELTLVPSGPATTFLARPGRVSNDTK